MPVLLRRSSHGFGNAESSCDRYRRRNGNRRGDLSAVAAEEAVPVIVNHDGPAIQDTLRTLHALGSKFGLIPMCLRTPEN